MWSGVDSPSSNTQALTPLPPTPRCLTCYYKPRVSTKYELATGHMMPTATAQLLP